MLDETTQQPKDHFPQILILVLHFSYTAKAMLCFAFLRCWAHIGSPRLPPAGAGPSLRTRNSVGCGTLEWLRQGGFLYLHTSGYPVGWDRLAPASPPCALSLPKTLASGLWATVLWFLRKSQWPQRASLSSTTPPGAVASEACSPSLVSPA